MTSLILKNGISARVKAVPEKFDALKKDAENNKNEKYGCEMRKAKQKIHRKAKGHKIRTIIIRDNRVMNSKYKRLIL